MLLKAVCLLGRAIRRLFDMSYNPNSSQAMDIKQQGCWDYKGGGIKRCLTKRKRNAFRTVAPPFPIHNNPNPPKTTTSNDDNETTTATTTTSTTIVFNRSYSLTLTIHLAKDKGGKRNRSKWYEGKQFSIGQGRIRR
jgi:hypothetical protein